MDSIRKPFGVFGEPITVHLIGTFTLPSPAPEGFLFSAGGLGLVRRVFVMSDFVELNLTRTQVPGETASPWVVEARELFKLALPLVVT